jgi:hypothetical protein
MITLSLASKLYLPNHFSCTFHHILKLVGNGRESIYDMEHPAPMTSDKLKKLGWKVRPLKETIAETVEFCQHAGFLEDVEGFRFPPLYNII